MYPLILFGSKCLLIKDQKGLINFFNEHEVCIIHIRHLLGGDLRNSVPPSASGRFIKSELCIPI